MRKLEESGDNRMDKTFKNLTNKEIICNTVNYDEERMNQLFKEIAKRLHEERVKQNYSTSELAFRAHVHPSSIHRIERGSGVSLQFLIKLSIALGKPIEYFIPIQQPYTVKTPGMKFEELTATLDVQTMNILFSIIQKTISHLQSSQTTSNEVK